MGGDVNGEYMEQPAGGDDDLGIFPRSNGKDYCRPEWRQEVICSVSVVNK